MRVRITNGDEPTLSVPDYVEGKRFYSTRECINCAIETLSSSRGRDGYWSALDVHYDENKQDGTWKSLYTLFSELEGDFTLLDGFGRGYRGEGPRGAIAMENFFDVLGMPVHRAILDNSNRGIYVEAPKPIQLRVTRKKIDIIKSRLTRAEYRSRGNLDDIRDGMDIEEALKIVNCYR